MEIPLCSQHTKGLGLNGLRYAGIEPETKGHWPMKPRRTFRASLAAVAKHATLPCPGALHEPAAGLFAPVRPKLPFPLDPGKAMAARPLNVPW